MWYKTTTQTWIRSPVGDVDNGEDSDSDGVDVGEDSSTKNIHLPFQLIYDKIRSCKSPLETVPHGIKNNVAFIVDNSNNMTKRKQGKQLNYIDDVGA